MIEHDYAEYDHSKQTAAMDARQVPRELLRQGQALIELHEAIDALLERTASARNQGPDDASTRGENPRPLLVPVADAIALGTRKIEDATARIQLLTNELEL